MIEPTSGIMQDMQASVWNSLDPDWAWAPWQPSDERKWDGALAAHLYRRAGFGATPEQQRAAADRDLNSVLDDLFN